MRFIFIICIGFIQCHFLYAQEIVLKGQISIHNSKFKTGEVAYVQNAFVSAPFTKPANTDAEGKFQLEFVGVNAGTGMRLKVDKVGFEVVNLYEIQQVVLGRTEPIRVFLIEQGGLEDAQLDLYNISKEALYQKRDSIIRQLRANEQQSQQTIKDLQERFKIEIANRQAAEEILNRQIEELEKRLPQFAMDLARHNLDFASDLYIEAYFLFLNGDIDKVIQLLDFAALEKINQKAEETFRKGEEFELAGKKLKEEAEFQFRENIENYKLLAESYLLLLDYENAAKAFENIIAILQEHRFDDRLLGQYLGELALLYDELYVQMANSSLDLDYAEIEKIGQKAVNYQEESVKIYKNIQDIDNSTLSSAYYDLCCVKMNFYEDVDSAIRYLNLAIDYHSTADTLNEHLVNLIWKYAEFCSLISHDLKPKKSKEYVNMSKSLYQLSITTGIELERFNEVGYICRKFADEYWVTYEEELTLLQTSLLAYQQADKVDEAELAETYIELGDAYYAIDTDSSLLYYKAAVAIYEEIEYGATYDFYHTERTMTYLDIANIYQYQENYDRAIEYHERYIEDVENESISVLDLLSRYDHIVSFYAGIGNYEKAIFYLEEYLEEGWGLGDDFPWKNMVYLDIADYAHEMKEYEMELTYLDSVINYYTSNKPMSTTDFYINYCERKKADALVLLSKNAKAKELYKRVLLYYAGLPKDDIDYEEVKLSNKGLSGIYESEGNYEKALAYWQDYITALKEDSKYEYKREKKNCKQKRKALKEKL